MSIAKKNNWDWKEFLEWDFYMKIGYGLAQAFSWLIWASVGLLLAASYGLTFSNSTLYPIMFFGFLGVYYYAIRKYEKTLNIIKDSDD